MDEGEILQCSLVVVAEIDYAVCELDGETRRSNWSGVRLWVSETRGSLLAFESWINVQSSGCMTRRLGCTFIFRQPTLKFLR